MKTSNEPRHLVTRAEQYQLICQQLDEAEPRLREHLPPSVSWDRFRSTVQTALRRNPELLNASPRSLLEACIQCASDGLLPDGREAALTVYAGKGGTTVAYMPMIYGLVRLALQSGMVLNWESRVAREGDEFEVVLGTNPSIRHRPNLTARGKMIAVYSIIETKAKKQSFEVMTLDEIRAARAKSRADTFWRADEEGMARTVVMRRHAKYLRTVCTSLARVMDRMNEIEFPPQHHEPQPKKRLTLDDIAQPVVADEPREDLPALPADDRPNDPVASAMQRGWDDAQRGVQRRAVPPEYRDPARKAEADAWLEGHKNYEQMQTYVEA